MEKFGALSPETGFLAELYKLAKEKESLPDRRPIYSIEITDNFSDDENKHWRWAGSLEQFEKDCREYCEHSEGSFAFVSKNRIEFRDTKRGGFRQQIITFKAVKV